MAEGIPNITGSYVATGVLLTIELGFKPKYVKLVNGTTGGTAEWVDSMGDDAVVTHDSGTDSAGIVADGITPTDTGFTVGTNAVINTSTNIVHYSASA